MSPKGFHLQIHWTVNIQRGIIVMMITFTSILDKKIFTVITIYYIFFINNWFPNGLNITITNNNNTDSSLVKYINFKLYFKDLINLLAFRNMVLTMKEMNHLFANLSEILGYIFPFLNFCACSFTNANHSC